MASISTSYAMLQDCARQNTVPFKKFDELQIGSWYKIEKFVLVHSTFGVKLAVRALNTAEYGGCFIINLPERFNLMANAEKVTQLNADEDKGYMYYGGKDILRKNRILISFEKHQLDAELLIKSEEGVQQSMDVPY